MNNFNIEAEGGELVLTNNYGDTAIIPRNKRQIVLKHLKSGNHTAIDNIVRNLPKMENYAEDGTLLPSINTNLLPGPGDPPFGNDGIKYHYENKMSADNYRAAVFNYMQNLYDSGNLDSMVVHSSERPKVGQQNNCINGVCNFVRELTGDKVLSKSYSGNIDFSDKAASEGWIRVPIHNAKDLLPGDMLRFYYPKQDYVNLYLSEGDATAEAWSKKSAEWLANNYYPHHTSYFGGAIDGNYIYLNNSGDEELTARLLSETDMNERFNNQNEPMYVYRYAPEMAKYGDYESAILHGKGNYAKEYNDVDKLPFTTRDGVNPYTGKEDGWFDMTVVDSDGAKDVVNYINKHYSKLGKIADMPKSTFNKLMKKLIGIGGIESGYGSLARYNIKHNIGDKAITELKSKGYGKGKELKWIDEMFKDPEINKHYKDLEDFKTDIQNDLDKIRNKKSKNNLPKRTQWGYTVKDYMKNSHGWFQQKALSKRGKFLAKKLFGIKDESKILLKMRNDVEFQTVMAAALMADNYHDLQNIYKGKRSEDELLDLTVLRHNAPTLSQYKRYLNYFYDNGKNNVDYINKVNNIIKNVVIDNN